MIVVDTNIIGYLFIQSERTSQALQAFQKDPDWFAPYLWRSEFRNVLTIYIRKKQISLKGGFRIMDDALRMMENRERLVSSYPVLELAASSTLSAYDCEFVVLARELNVPLVTVDREILGRFPDTAIPLESFTAS